MSPVHKTQIPIAIGARLKKYPGIRTLGFKPNFTDYNTAEQELIIQARKIYYPTAFYADLFNTMGKATFPSYHTYKFAQDKIKQTAVFNLKGIPHPRTRVFYGTNQKKNITRHFMFPFVAKVPRGSARGTGVFLIETRQALTTYLDSINGPAYIQEYLPMEKDMRLVVIGNKVRLAFWRTAAGSEFRTNISQGGDISFDPMPPEAHKLALDTAEQCGWDDVGIDIARCNNKLYVLEGNMKYGTKGFQKAGINYKNMLAELIVRGEI